MSAQKHGMHTLKNSELNWPKMLIKPWFTRAALIVLLLKVMLAEFKPYLDNTVLDVIHSDPAFGGGITGVKRIADYAALGIGIVHPAAACASVLT